MIFQVGMSQNIGKRSVQQDSIGRSDKSSLKERGLLLVLSDGISSMEAGERFSGLAVEEMMKAYQAESPDKDLLDRLLSFYKRARQAALHLRLEEGIEGGATVTAVLAHHGKCAFVSSGDSRLYLLRGKGLIQLNREQQMGHVLDERAALGLTLREEAERRVYRKALSNHLAMEEELPLDYCEPFQLLGGDRMILISDGVFSTLSEAELEEILADPARTASEAAEDVIEAVMKHDQPRQDNCSVIVLIVKEAQKRSAL